MKEIWKVLTIEDGREILTAYHKVDSLEMASKLAQDIVPILTKYHAQAESSLSISSDYLSITLHGQSTEPISDSDWQLAKEIEQVLQ